VVATGETVMLAEVAELFQAKEVPPLAVSVALAPLQIAVDTGLIAATGFWFTVTVLESDAVQLFASVTVTEYVVVDAGATVTVADVAE